MSHNRLHGRGFFSSGIMARAKSERKYKSDDCFLRCPVPPRQLRVVARLSWKIRDSFQFFPTASPSLRTPYHTVYGERARATETATRRKKERSGSFHNISYCWYNGPASVCYTTQFAPKTSLRNSSPSA